MAPPLASLFRPGAGRRRLRALAAALAAPAALCGTAMALSGALPRAALAQGTPSVMEFRWDNTKDYRKLYYFVTDTIRSKRADWYFVLKPKDRKTAMLKLTISVPSHFDAKIDPRRVKLCTMKLGSVTSRTRCLETIPATVEVAANGSAIEVFPDTPVPAGQTVGVMMTIINPSNIGMYQFNALVQAPGDVPMAGYVGSWLVQIDATSN
ncbi:MAG: DUF2808 domain-containing protein [Prochlorococcaceae cyanobacterium]